jgi:hypothetical protein
MRSLRADHNDSKGLPTVFFRLHTDGTRTPAALEHAFAGPTRTPCWIIGGGPSLANLPCAGIARTPVPKFCVNLAGHGLFRPNLWTSYDPSARFQRSIYLDASILKFVHERRAMDLVPETTFKVCECPATFFFERDPQRGFADFLGSRVESQGSREHSRLSTVDSRPSIVDWNDSLVQAIDIAYRLGFRVLYLAGCEMFVQPPAEHLELAATNGVTYAPRETLAAFYERCEKAGLARGELERCGLPVQYHFDERKPLAATINTDMHYFRVSQYLRLVRRSLALAGMDLVSVTPQSRLNDYFPYRRAEDVLREIVEAVGNPALESTRGRYTLTGMRSPEGLGPMRDFRPHHSPKFAPAAPVRQGAPVGIPGRTASDVNRSAARSRLRQALDELPEIEVGLNELG